jgi:hypothetical protein
MVYTVMPSSLGVVSGLCQYDERYQMIFNVPGASVVCWLTSFV